MSTLIATHKVDAAPDFFPPARGGFRTDVRTFVDPIRPIYVGLIMEVADMAAFHAVMERGGRGGHAVQTACIRKPARSTWRPTRHGLGSEHDSVRPTVP